jgi:hypothetical protein
MNANLPSSTNEITLIELFEKIKDWYTYLLSKWKPIFLTVIFGVILGLTYSFIKKPIYTATLSFALEDEKSGGGGLGSALGLASTLGLDLGGGGGSIFTGSNLTELFKSRTMVEKTLLSPVDVNGKVISLAEMYIQNNGWREKWSKKPKFAHIQFLPNTDRKLFTRVHDSILGVIYENLSKKSLSVMQKDKKIAIITMDVSSNNELFSLYFCEASGQTSWEILRMKQKVRKLRMNMSILQRQVDSVRAELNSAITGVAVANDNTFMLQPMLLNVKRRAPSARRQVDVQANTAILTELVKQSELAKVTLRRETPLIQVIDRPILPLAKERLGKVKGNGDRRIYLAGFLIVLILIVRRLLKLLTH